MKNLLGILLPVLFLLSCGTENKPTYTLTTTVSPPEGGTITLSPSDGVYSEGETVTLTGNPNSDGWRFVRWEGDWSSTDNPTTITVNRDYNIVGVFERRDYPLNIEIIGEGTVEEVVIQSKSNEYPYETIVELTPIPSQSWEFVEWGGDLSGNQVPIQITVNEEKNVTIKFERRNYPLNITIIGEGTVEETVVQLQSTEYPYETVVELTPIPSGGWFFWNYRGDLSWNSVPQNIVVDEEKNVTVTFIRKSTIDFLVLYSYDSNNNLIELILYNTNGSVIERWIYSYDTNNNLIELVVYRPNGTVIERQTYSYDSNNNLIEQIGYNPDGTISFRSIYSYDSNNNLIEQIGYNPDGTISFRWTYFYDSNNNLIEQIWYNPDGTISFRWTYFYDSNNNLIEQIGYNPDGTIFFRSIYSYDSNNNLIEQIGYNPDGTISFRSIYSYDSNNNLIEQIRYNSDGSIFFRLVYSYDSNNNLIERFQYNSLPNTSNPKYQYDPFKDLKRHVTEPYDKLHLFPHRMR